jgi:hypothetical protein
MLKPIRMLCAVRALALTLNKWPIDTVYIVIDMSTTQTRLSDHIDVFYGASDRTSDGAMAAHAYKRSVEELDASVTRELVRFAWPFD